MSLFKTKNGSEFSSKTVRARASGPAAQNNRHYYNDTTVYTVALVCSYATSSMICTCPLLGSLLAMAGLVCSCLRLTETGLPPFLTIYGLHLIMHQTNWLYRT